MVISITMILRLWVNGTYSFTLCLFNIAMENGPFIDGFVLKTVIFYGYVK